MRCNELGSWGGDAGAASLGLPRKRIGMVQQGCIAVAMDHSGIGEQAMRMAQRHAYVAIVRSEQEILRLSEEWESCVILLGWCDGTGESTERLIRKVRQARLALPIVVLSDAVRGRQMTEARRLQLAMAGARAPMMCIGFGSHWSGPQRPICRTPSPPSTTWLRTR